MKRLALILAALACLAFTASAGARTVRCTVPKLSGVTLKVAHRRLLHAHCRAGLIHRPKIAAGGLIVARQRPRAGVHRKRGARITIWLKAKPVKLLTTAPAPITTTTTTAPTAPAPAPSVRAAIDPSFTQNASNPLIVTWAYSAGVTDGTLPDGILSLTVYEHGQVASAGGCTIDVGGLISGGNCTLTLPQYGDFDVTVSYASSSSLVSPSTSTDTETIEPFPVTNVYTWDTDAPTTGAYVHALLVGNQATVTVGDPNFEGATSVNLTDSTGAQCTAIVSGIAATCTMTDIATPTAYTISYPGGTTTTTTVSTADNGQQSVTDEWPATVVQINDPVVTVQQATVDECGGSAQGTTWSSTSGCSAPFVQNPWPNPLTIATGQYANLTAVAYGSLASDQNPIYGGGYVSGYLSFVVTGGVEGTDWTEYNADAGTFPDDSADCSDVTIQQWFSATNTYGPDEPVGTCSIRFLTPGTYTVQANYVSEDPNYANQAGPSITIMAVP